MNPHYCSENHILIGLGGTGGRILREIRKRLFEEFPDDEERKELPVAFLYVDSNEGMMPQDGRPMPDFQVYGQDASFTHSEFLNINSIDIPYILSHLEQFPSLQGIVKNAEDVRGALGCVMGEQLGGKRLAGRLLFAAHAEHYNRALQHAYEKVSRITGCGGVRIHLFTGLAGATGSGAVVDAIVQARKHFPDATIHVFAQLLDPHSSSGHLADMLALYGSANTYAALNELNALQIHRWIPCDVTGDQEADFYSYRYSGVANTLTVFGNENVCGVTLDPFSEMPKQVSDYVFNRLFLVNDCEANEVYLRFYDFESMADYAYEYDENQYPLPITGEIPVARTKFVNTFGFKRVVNSDSRVFKHLAYTVGESVLYQLMYNNWREDQGYVNEALNRDIRVGYFILGKVQRWMLAFPHLTLERKLLPHDHEYDSFSKYWHDKAIHCAKEAKKADCPLMELDNILNDHYENLFREEGVENYYRGKSNVIPEISKEICGRIEQDLFRELKDDELSLSEIQQVSRLFEEHFGKIRTELAEAYQEEWDNYGECDNNRHANLIEWSRLGLLQRMAGHGARHYADHQSILADYYTSKTRLVALEFAQRLADRLLIELQRLEEDISAFVMRINEAIVETHRIVEASRINGNGWGDMRGPVVDLCDGEAVRHFATDLMRDKCEMPYIAREMRRQILPEEFQSFWHLASEITPRDISVAFDTKLAEIIRTDHEVRVDRNQRVLGVNVLDRLQQQLRSDEDMKSFARSLVRNSEVYLRLDPEQYRLVLRNNENFLGKVNHFFIFVTVPSAGGNPTLECFADKLEAALGHAVNSTYSCHYFVFNRHGPRHDEISIVSMRFIFPFRCIEGIKTYKEQADKYLHRQPGQEWMQSLALYPEGSANFPSLLTDEQKSEEQ